VFAMRVRAAVLVGGVLSLAACTSLPPECKTEYAHTLTQCAKPKPRLAGNTMKICQGNTGQTLRCEQVPRDAQIREIKQQLPRPR
jgi:hypothetical protein